VVNESADTIAALNHIKKQINSFLEMYNGSSLDSLFMKITDVSSSKSYGLKLPLFGKILSGRTDLIISPSNKYISQTNYCNIQLKTVVKSKFEDSEDNAGGLTAQSITELLASCTMSKCPTMQFTTDLDQNYQIMFLSQINGEDIKIRHYKLSGTNAIVAISMWLLYFCPHMHGVVELKPKTTDLKLLADIQRAYQNIKKKIKSAPQTVEQDSELASVVVDKPICLGTEEDIQSKCQRWVDQFT